MTDQTQDNEPIIIKKYANRRLYNTETSSYVTLDHLAQLVREGRDFVVQDAKSQEDITRAVLTQIIFDQESKGQQMLPVPFLRQLISFYGDQMQAMVPGYLQSAMDAFTSNEDQMRSLFESGINPTQIFSMMDDAAQQNMAIFKQAMNLFNPLSAMTAKPQVKPAPQKDGNDKIDALEKQLAAMQEQLDSMRKK